MNEIDWTIVTPEVMTLAEKAATTVAAQNQGVIEYDDLYQEALLALAQNAGRAREHLENDRPGLVYNEVLRDCMNTAEKAATVSRRQVSWTRLQASL